MFSMHPLRTPASPEHNLPCPPLSDCGPSEVHRQCRTNGRPAPLQAPEADLRGQHYTPASPPLIEPRCPSGWPSSMKAIKPYLGTIVVVLVTIFVVFRVVPMNLRKTLVGA